MYGLKRYLRLYDRIWTLSKPYLRADRGLWATLAVGSVLAALTEGVSVTLLIPLLDAGGQSSLMTETPVLSDILSLIEPEEPNARLRVVAAALAVGIFIRFVLIVAMEFVSQLLWLRNIRRLVFGGYERLLTVRIGYLDERKSGTLHNIYTSQAGRASSVIQSMGRSFISIALVVIYVCMLMLVSWQIAMVCFAIMFAFSAGLTTATLAPMRRYGEAVTAHTRVNTQCSLDTLANMRLVRLRGAADLMREIFRGSLRRVTRASFKQQIVGAAISPVFTLVSGFLICGVIILFSLSRPAGDTEWVPLVVMSVFMLTRLIGPVSQLNQLRASIETNYDAFEEIESFRSETEANREPSGSIEFQGLESGVEFRGVGFSYGSEGERTLRDITFEVPRGRMIALVGPSGAGKSTIVNLLGGFYRIDEGAILVDGVDLHDLDIGSWRRRIEIVSQDSLVLNESVLANLTFGSEDITTEAVQEAISLAQAAEFISKLPQGLETTVGERGVKLSGGQRQRLALARALLTSPDVLVLDEPTSQLDSITEHAIQRNIDRLRGRCTMLVIAHRLATVKLADYIMVLDSGRIVQTGVHDDLREQEGPYREMLLHQTL